MFWSYFEGVRGSVHKLATSKMFKIETWIIMESQISNWTTAIKYQKRKTAYFAHSKEVYQFLHREIPHNHQKKNKKTLPVISKRVRECNSLHLKHDDDFHSVPVLQLLLFLVALHIPASITKYICNWLHTVPWSYIIMHIWKLNYMRTQWPRLKVI